MQFFGQVVDDGLQHSVERTSRRVKGVWQDVVFLYTYNVLCHPGLCLPVSLPSLGLLPCVMP